MDDVVEVVVLVAAKVRLVKVKSNEKTSSPTNEYLRILGCHNKNNVLCTKSYIWSSCL